MSFHKLCPHKCRTPPQLQPHFCHPHIIPTYLYTDLSLPPSVIHNCYNQHPPITLNLSQLRRQIHYFWNIMVNFFLDIPPLPLLKPPGYSILLFLNPYSSEKWLKFFYYIGLFNVTHPYETSHVNSHFPCSISSMVCNLSMQRLGLGKRLLIPCP